MIKFPSIESTWQQLIHILQRFPLQVIISLFTVCIWIWGFENPTIQNKIELHKLLVLCNFALTLSLSANLYSKLRSWKTGGRWMLQIVALVPCVILFIVLSPQFFQADVLRIVLFIFAGHLLVSFSAYSDSDNILDFWHFNKVLFLRFLTAVLFSAVLFGGLAIAFASIDTLFNYPISGDAYFKLFIVVAVGFHTLFFLAGVPQPTTRIEDRSYPRVLKIFTQYVLIPLITLYLVILAVYELKIIINAQLPDGMVSILILGYAVLGILSYLLIYPINRDSGNEWMRQFAKLFFWLMLPLLGLLFVAVWVRVAEYGLTEMRYFVLIMAIWLLGITLYFIIHKSPRIQLIPISLFVFTLLSTYGPQSAATLSKKSQQKRLATYMGKDDQESLTQKISIINYLVDFHGLTALQAFTPTKLSDVQKDIMLPADTLKTDTYVIRQNLRDTAFSILDVDANYVPPDSQFVNFVNKEKLLPNEGYDYAYWLQHTYADDLDSPLGKIVIESKPNHKLTVKIGETDSVTFDIRALERKLIKGFDASDSKSEDFNREVDKNNHVLVKPELMTLSSVSLNYTIEIRVQFMNVSRSAEDKNSSAAPVSGYLLIARK